ncbi:DNAJB12, partial [Cordylochernes scorpioides]
MAPLQTDLCRATGRGELGRTDTAWPTPALYVCQANGLSSLIQIMPVLLLVFLPLLSSLFVAEPPFSLSRTSNMAERDRDVCVCGSKYIHERKTHNLKVPYFVKDNFLAEHQGDIRRIEMEVEEERLQNLRASCFKEENHSEFGISYLTWTPRQDCVELTLTMPLEYTSSGTWSHDGHSEFPKAGVVAYHQA